VTAFGPTVFEKWNLCGATITFTVNLATTRCGTAASFYLVGMPAAAAGSNGDYYCDSNCVGGHCCPEVDLMEANRHALQITLHKCTSTTSSCDSGAINTQSISLTDYGPSSSYTINTSESFTVAITFTCPSGTLTTVTSVISQGSNSLTLTHSSTAASSSTASTITTNCGSGYLTSVGSSMSAGMVPVFSYWSGSMSWLDSPACSSDTNEESNSQEIISNIVITGEEMIPTNGTGRLSRRSPLQCEYCAAGGSWSESCEDWSFTFCGFACYMCAKCLTEEGKLQLACFGVTDGACDQNSWCGEICLWNNNGNLAPGSC